MFGFAAGDRDRKPGKAVCLLSGGLDSALAAKLMLEQGIRVSGVHFVIPFVRRDKDRSDLPVRKVGDSLGINVEIVELGEDYVEIVRAPRHGYGRNMNPCIDCKIHMLKIAGTMMRAGGADFVVTGEVVGQRPMSQRMDTMRRIEKQSGLEGYLVRPLSAHLLGPTRPEIEGLIRRDELLGVHGRSRKDLLRMAEEKGVGGYSSPGGGCLLTDPRYAQRVRDLLEHDMLTIHDIDLLGAGRHFRLPCGSKLVVGRHKSDNESLSSMAGEEDLLLITPHVPGPTAILRGPGVSEDEELACRIVARYSDASASDKVGVRIVGPGGMRSMEVNPLGPGETAELMI